MNWRIRLTFLERNAMEGNIKFSVILSKRAANEVTDSWKWYEERQNGLGDRFFKESIAHINLIEKFPERYSCKYKLYRETSLTIFPYAIIYKINKRKKIVQVVSVFHSSRNPAKRYK